MSSLAAALLRPRPWPLALGLAFLVGAALTLALLPLPVILGTAPFWAFPRGTTPGGLVDMGQELMGYRYLVQAPWMLPFLQVPAITPPGGMNAFWLDPVPWLALLARPVSALAGGTVNLLGLFLFLAFALPGAAMAALLRAAGQRGLAPAVAAALLACSMPPMLFEWGHIALCAQVLVVAALALYTAGLAAGRIRPWPWFLLLALALLTHLYLFVMVGGIWTAAFVQAALDRAAPRRALAAQAGLTMAGIVALGAASGILSPDLRSGGTTGFGIFSLNLASPFLPQLSGAIPPLRHYWTGLHVQVLGWPGLGVWLVALAALALARPDPRPILRRHAALAAVLLAFYLFALSNRVFLGAHLLLDIRLPQGLAYALGAFRASGRFVWPVLFTLLAAGLVGLLQQRRKGVALAVLALASVLQVVDAGPIRAAITASTTAPAPPAFDRAAMAAWLDTATALMVFPTSGCIDATVGPDATETVAGRAEAARLAVANVELQLLASEKNLRLNTVVNSRLPTDCTAEAATRGAALRPGAAYVYLAGPPPAPAQLGGRDPATACRRIGPLLACRIPGRIPG